MHQLELQRVRQAIGAAIARFLRDRLASGRPEFHAEDLRRAVAAVSPTAPASADRVMRAMRQAGEIDYELVSRRDSLYRALDPATRRVA
jgi:hypothetical protein